jgi:hypothetical protein
MNQTVFSVTSEQLAALDAKRAVELVANILWAEVRRIGLPTTRVNISTRINVADGGVDASVDMTNISDVGRTFIHDGRSAFQVKAGTSFKPWQDAEIRKELFGDELPSKAALGESVRACLDENGAYVLVCTGTDPNETELPAAKGHLRKYFDLCGYQSASIGIWGQNTLMGLLQDFPSLALDLNGGVDSQFLAHGAWSKQAEMRGAFKPGDRQRDFIESLQKELRLEDRPVHVRVRGEAGIGKTRLVLEATAAGDISPLIIYCDRPTALLEGSLMRQLVREDVHRVAILVVDECDLEKRTLIWNQLQFHSPRIKLISIYNDLDEPAGTTIVFDAPPLEEAQVVEIIQVYGIPKDDAQRWAEYCDGSPRVAHVIGLNLKNNPDDVLRDPDTINVWDRYVAWGDDLKSPEVQQRRIVLRFVALFRRFGYSPPVSGEAKAIAALIESANPQITWTRFQEIVKLLRDRKILQGEVTLYITPRLLHIKLWADWWDTYGEGSDVSKFAGATGNENIPSQLLEWFREMFQYAAQSKAALKITKELLRQDGRFGNLSFFETGRASFFLSLAIAAPEAALRYLEETLGTWDSQRLANFKSGRREVVWSLERIAVWAPLFRGSAKLLLKLAEAENESFSNNATGVFADLFTLGQGVLASTEASPEERFPILKNALESSSKREREVALTACDHALKSSYLTRMVGAEYQGLRRPPRLWMPHSWIEIFDGYRRVWLLVVEKLPTLASDEFEKAVTVLTNHVRGLSRFPDLCEMIVATLADLAERFPQSRPKIIEAVEVTLHYDGKGLSIENFKLYDALRTGLTEGDFHSQMERYVGMELLHDGFDANGNIIDKSGPKIRALAKQVIENSELLTNELSWLVTGKAKNGYRFGRELGTLDTDFKLLEDLLVAQQNAAIDGNPFFLGGYFSQLFERKPELWEQTLDRIVTNPKLRNYVTELTWRSGMTERAALRILSMAKSGLFPLASLRMFAFGGVVRKIPEYVFWMWIDCLLQADTRIAAWTALDLFHFYYLMSPGGRPLPRELALRLLTARPFFRKRESPSAQTEEYDWTQIAKAFINQHPFDGLTIARHILDSLGEEDSITDSYSGEVLKVLSSITARSPVEAWRLTAQRLGPPIDSRSFRIARWLRDGALMFMLPTEVWSWIDGDISSRAWYAATFVPPRLEHQTTEICWARELLIRYGDRKDVRQNLHANFSTGSWWGPETTHHQGNKQMLENFRKGETDANVLRWLDEAIERLDYRIEEAQVREERRF